MPDIPISPDDVTATWDETPKIPGTQGGAPKLCLSAKNSNGSPSYSFEGQGMEKIVEALESQGKGQCGPSGKEQELREKWLREAFFRLTSTEGTISCGFGKGGTRSKKGYSIHKDDKGNDQIFIHPDIEDKDAAIVLIANSAIDLGMKLGRDVAQVGSAMGPYPHMKLADNKQEEKDGIRQLKCVCPVCGYTVRTSSKWLDKYGTPYCPALHDYTKSTGHEFLLLSNGVKLFRMAESKPIHLDVEAESVKQSGDHLEITTKKHD